MEIYNHEEYQRRYNSEKQLLTGRIEERKSNLRKAVIITVSAMVVEFILMILLYTFVGLFFGMLVTYLFIAGIVVLYGCKKQFEKCEADYRIGLNKILDRLEKDDLYDYSPPDDVTIIVTKDKRKRKKIIIITAVVLILTYFIGIGAQALFTFDPLDWQTKPWKRKYMIDDLMRQQDWYTYGKGQLEYNIKYMTKEEVHKLLTVRDGRDVDVDINIQVNEPTEIFYAYTDKDGNNVWLVAFYAPSGYYLGKYESGDYVIDTIP